MEFITIKLKDRIIIYGGNNLQLDVDYDNLIIKNADLEIELSLPISKYSLEKLYLDLKGKISDEDIAKLFRILKNHFPGICD